MPEATTRRGVAAAGFVTGGATSGRGGPGTAFGFDNSQVKRVRVLHNVTKRQLEVLGINRSKDLDAFTDVECRTFPIEHLR